MTQRELIGFAQTATIQGVEALPVTVEISIGSGLPGFHIIGLPDLAVKEATRRVRQALKISGYAVKNAMVIVNLAPSDLRKAGSGFDLPIALAYLLATDQIAADLIGNSLCVGELSLDGAVRSVNGQLAYERLASQTGQRLLTGPCTTGISQQSGVQHVCLENLADLRSGQFSAVRPAEAPSHFETLDFADIAGNDLAKRALQIAAAGQHGLLMIGPPGAGKSMMARRLPSILPPLDEDARLESALIHSVAGLPFDGILAGQQPFRAPHHGASRAGLIGGGVPIQPGEISLAHNGVLFLDELPEFGSSVLQLLRQPIELGYIALARAQGTVIFPARFMLIAAANPCPCGYLGDDRHSCRCTPDQIKRYLGRIGGPLLDRISLIVDVRRSAAAEVLATGQGLSSAQLRAGVEQARQFADWRRRQQRSAQQPVQDTPTTDLPATDLPSTELPAVSPESLLLAACELGEVEQAWLEMAADRYQLSGRGIISTLAVARTIADLVEERRVRREHLIEAIGYRSRGEL
ncbi:MAG: YifB family Mg chelatase-like AAA ATPase [Actinomycetia bacterium]|nr:YifB family Mg chelatase-like AAA ATPase [Actinomycetes bacterium]